MRLPCHPCQSARTICDYGDPKESPSTEITWTPELSNHTELPDKRELQHLVKAYFDGPHFFCFYTFIHQPTFEKMLDDGVVPESLRLIVIATGLRFLEPDNPLPDQWADISRRLVMGDIFAPPSMTTLQALLLLQRFEWHRAAHINAWLLSGLAVRLAHGLQLNIETDDSVPVTLREQRRRLLWSCFVMESMIEAGRSPLSGLDASSIEVKLPCDERSFQLGVETDMPSLDSLIDSKLGESGMDTVGKLATGSRPGVSAFLVQLAGLRIEILRYMRSYHPRNKDRVPQTHPWDRESPFIKFEAKLKEWNRNLPNELRFVPDVIYRRRSQLFSFVTLHCLFHGCYCDLYRVGALVVSSHHLSSCRHSTPLPAQAEPFLENGRRGRLQHAFEICSIISDVLDHQPSGHDPVVAMCISLAVRVLVAESRPGDIVALGLTDEIVHAKLSAAVKCAAQIVPRSVPILQLVRTDTNEIGCNVLFQSITIHSFARYVALQSSKATISILQTLASMCSTWNTDDSIEATADLARPQCLRYSGRAATANGGRFA